MTEHTNGNGDKVIAGFFSRYWKVGLIVVILSSGLTKLIFGMEQANKTLDVHTIQLATLQETVNSKTAKEELWKYRLDEAERKIKELEERVAILQHPQK